MPSTWLRLQRSNIWSQKDKHHLNVHLISRDSPWHKLNQSRVSCTTLFTMARAEHFSQSQWSGDYTHPLLDRSLWSQCKFLGFICKIQHCTIISDALPQSSEIWKIRFALCSFARCPAPCARHHSIQRDIILSHAHRVPLQRTFSLTDSGGTWQWWLGVLWVDYSTADNRRGRARCQYLGTNIRKCQVGVCCLTDRCADK